MNEAFWSLAHRQGGRENLYPGLTLNFPMELFLTPQWGTWEGTMEAESLQKSLRDLKGVKTRKWKTRQHLGRDPPR